MSCVIYRVRYVSAMKIIAWYKFARSSPRLISAARLDQLILKYPLLAGALVLHPEAHHREMQAQRAGAHDGILWPDAGEAGGAQPSWRHARYGDNRVGGHVLASFRRRRDGELARQARAQAKHGIPSSQWQLALLS